MSAARLQAEMAATAAKRSSFGALRALGVNPDPPACPYPQHRPSDWRLRAGGPVQCGVCHPPVDGLDIVEFGL